MMTKSLTSYNIDNYSIITGVDIPRVGTKTRCKVVSRVNDNSDVYLNTTDESNEDDEGEYPHCNDSGTYGTNCDNCEDISFIFMQRLIIQSWYKKNR